MESLVGAIVTLEEEADALLAEAEAEAKAMGHRAEEEAASYRDELAREVEQRVAAFEEEAARQHASDLAGAEEALRAGLETIDGLSESAVQHQVERVVSRFREW